MRRLGAGALVCGAAWPGVARADADVRTTTRGCEEYDLVRLDELLAIEVETVRSQHPSRPSDVILECRGSAVTAQVALRGSKFQKGTVVNPGTADRAARTRLLALSISELLAQLWSDAEASAHRAELAKPNEPVAPRAESAPSAAGDAFAAYATLTVRGLLGPGAGLVGASAGAELRLPPVVAIGANLEGVFGDTQRDYATIRMTLASASAHALIEGRAGRFAIGGGAGARFGVVRLVADDVQPAATGHDVSGPWGGPLALCRARWSAGRFDLYASLESGVIALPFAGTVNGEARLVDIRGVWIASSAGLAAVF